ncbi:MAG: ATP-binding cassette domain-containing protein [Limisphaerales bacterium]
MNLILKNIKLPLADFDLELDVELRGLVTAIFGASGAGKTSLLELVAGLRKRKSAFVQFGKTVLDNTAQKKFVPPRARRIGYVPQDAALFPHFSVRGNLLYGTRNESRTALELEHVSEVLEIEPLLSRRVGDLSGGEKQRVACARALLAQPKLLLLDEPFSALDQPLREKAISLLQRVRAEFRLPMLFVSHLADEIVALCDEVIVLERGRCVRHGRPTEVFSPVPTTAYRLNGSIKNHSDKAD